MEKRSRHSTPAPPRYRSATPITSKVLGTIKETRDDKKEGLLGKVLKMNTTGMTRLKLFGYEEDGKTPVSVAHPGRLLGRGFNPFKIENSDDKRNQKKKFTFNPSNLVGYEGRVNFDSMYESVRNTIALFPLGVSVQRLLHHVNSERKFAKTWDLFPGKSDKDVIDIFAELFIIDSLPGRETVLLFPSTMPMSALTAVEIVERVWSKMVFIVRFRGGPLGAIRDFDMSHFYEELWHVRIDIEDWGFTSYPEFVDWAMELWNRNGKEDGLTVKEFGSRPKEGTDEQEPTFLLYFKLKSV